MSDSLPPHTHTLMAAVKNQVTGHFILNAKSEDAEPKKFIENGLEWEYSMDGEKETLKTSGPLHEGIVVMVSEGGECGSAPLASNGGSIFS